VQVKQGDLRLDESHEIGYLRIVEGEPRHAPVWASGGDDRAEEVAVLIVARNRGPDEVGGAATGGILAVAGGTRSQELLAAAFGGIRLRLVLGSSVWAASRRPTLRSILLSPDHEDSGKNNKQDKCKSSHFSPLRGTSS